MQLQLSRLRSLHSTLEVSMYNDDDGANQTAFYAAHIPGWLFYQIGEPPEPASLQELTDLQCGRASAYRQLPPTQDHRQGELRQGQTGTACAHWTRGECHERVVLTSYVHGVKALSDFTIHFVVCPPDFCNTKVSSSSYSLFL